MSNTYRRECEEFLFIRQMEDWIKSRGLNIHLLRDQKRRLRQQMALNHPDPMQLSLNRCTKTICPYPDGEMLYEYTLLPPTWTEEQLAEKRDNELIRHNCAYDCTGQLFSRWVYWKRVPCGIVWIHCKVRDV